MNKQKRLFGTDGVRGVANRDLTCEMAFYLGASAVRLLGPTLVIGRDTRMSGSMLEAALVAGITSRGGRALLAGIIPTPAVALLTRQLNAQGGIVISASHNPPEFNGIKFFDAEGYKISRELEDKMEESLHVLASQKAAREPGDYTARDLPTGCDIGSVLTLDDAHERYIAYVVDILLKADVSLEGLTIAVDCGHGASHYVTPEALRRLGATVFAINDGGDGSVINVESGSTDLRQIRTLVKEKQADIGIAHDGDADRVIAVSASGAEIDGDYIAAICALDRKATGSIPSNTVVSTVMCNLGFLQAMEHAGLTVLQTPVGDANVLAAMREGGYVIGGEQSGHMIFIEHNTTGDGLATALMLLSVMKRSGKTLDCLASSAMEKYPQVLINVRVENKHDFAHKEALLAAIAEAEETLQLSGGGRVLVRPSGTEPLVRVMVEAANEDIAQRIAQGLARIVETELA